MISLLADSKPELARLCETHGVKRLTVFGSAVSGRFDPATSDVDFLVAFRDTASRRIVGMRNRIIHGYDSVDDELLWSVAATNVPALAASLRKVLGLPATAEDLSATPAPARAR